MGDRGVSSMHDTTGAASRSCPVEFPLRGKFRSGRALKKHSGQYLIPLDRKLTSQPQHLIGSSRWQNSGSPSTGWRATSRY